MSVSLKELAATLNNLRQFLKRYDKTRKSPFCLHTNQSKRLVLIYLKTNSLHIFSRTLKNTATHRCVFFRLERNEEYCFSIKKVQIVGEQNILTEIINLRHCEVHSLNKNGNYIASKCGIFSKCDIRLKHSGSGT